MTRHCPYCGSEVSASNDYCEACGGSLNEFDPSSTSQDTHASSDQVHRQVETGAIHSSSSSTSTSRRGALLVAGLAIAGVIAVVAGSDAPEAFAPNSIGGQGEEEARWDFDARYLGNIVYVDGTMYNTGDVRIDTARLMIDFLDSAGRTVTSTSYLIHDIPVNGQKGFSFRFNAGNADLSRVVDAESDVEFP